VKGWQQITLGIFIGFLLAGLVLIFVLPQRGSAIVLITKTPDLTPIPTATLSLIRVHLTGAVNAPGMLTLPKGACLVDAIEKAGGLIEGYDSNLLNLAEILQDGARIHIPNLVEQESDFNNPQRSQPLLNIEEPILVNINTADLDTLVLLPGIGPSKAQAIINYREQNGLFMRIEDIQKVKGIGPGIFDSIKDLITIDD
jgi:competence protein ComEA